MTDLFLQEWLTLCVRTSDGAVSCSAAPPARTEVCILRGDRNVRCGEGKYDAGVVGATKIVPYPSRTYYSLESSKRLFVSDMDEGGCTIQTDGIVRCWERDRCARGFPWRSAEVAGLPKVREIVLGSHDGYALTANGEAYTWPRRDSSADDDCTASPPYTMHARRLELGSNVRQLLGGTYPAKATPTLVGLDCAVLENEEITCWRTGKVRDGHRFTVTP